MSEISTFQQHNVGWVDEDEVMKHDQYTQTSDHYFHMESDQCIEEHRDCIDADVSDGNDNMFIYHIDRSN